jgi:hypothetical protein
MVTDAMMRATVRAWYMVHGLLPWLRRMRAS